MTRSLRSVHIARAVMAVALSCLSGCVLWMREGEFYASEIGELLDGAKAPVEACYDRHLAEHDARAGGKVVVSFEVERKTGRLTHIVVDPAQSDAPEPLAACVSESMSGLVLDPPDANTAQATFTWQFTPGSQKRPPPDPFAGVQDTVLGCYSAHLREVDRFASGDVAVDYAFDRETGAVAKLEVIAAKTTAPAQVVACIEPALASARVAPEQLDDRNAAGQRTFTLRFVPDAGAAP